ncbi:MAG: HTH-type transcriptional regulator/antitoxin HigA [Planctomycetaceae bacterium]|jgi:HTH-type transcriptional regulator/antitoxin HigA
MASVAPAPYRPETVSPPGKTIADMLEDLGMSQAELARRLGRPSNKLNQIIKGTKAITADTALELESVLGLPASFWLNREQNYRLALSERERLERQTENAEIVRNFPYAEMARHGWVQQHTSRVEKYRELLRFFAVAGNQPLEHTLDRVRNCVGELAPSFRKSKIREANPEALAAWLRQCTHEAQQIDVAEFDKATVRASLEEFRALTLQPFADVTRQLPQLAAKFGIRVVFVPHLQKTYVGGAAFWAGGSPVIGLTFRYKTNDWIWFNFFHELGHILLHSPKHTWLDDFSDDQESHEVEANEFAANTLIPADAYAKFLSEGRRSKAAVRTFARKIGIAPGIVVGRLQKFDGLPPSHLNGLKERLEV